ncbi:Conserved DNA-binding protein YbaB [Sinosporangium album]|uniref:Conserved DNA-binding protein YbaB n=1 Tax=Sinosporangium album TaxID=504805 RepID=A0A1G8JGK2_9ACTN|nr:YbaB/EbfC family nucleoid-associated protein [Sinosporangium album]SDI30306.1 Conserved DNA-binding protein YbaB [Sinosporangium album]
MRHNDAFDTGPGDIGKLVGDIHNWVDAMATTLRELEEQTLTGYDESGRVTAKVSGSGRLLKVTVAPQAMRDLDHVEVAEAVRQAIEAARIAMAEELTTAMNALTHGMPQPDPNHDPFAAYFNDILRGG